MPASRRSLRLCTSRVCSNRTLPFQHNTIKNPAGFRQRDFCTKSAPVFIGALQSVKNVKKLLSPHFHAGFQGLCKADDSVRPAAGSTFLRKKHGTYVRTARFGVGAEAHIGPLGSCEFAVESRKIGAFCRADVGIGPYEQTGKCIRIRQRFLYNGCILQSGQSRPPLRSVCHNDRTALAVSSAPAFTGALAVVQISWESAGRRTAQLSLRRATLYAAFAGLVEGSSVAGRPVVGA